MNIFPGSLRYALPLVATVMLTGGIAMYAFRRSTQVGAIALAWMTTSISVWSIFYILELLAPDLSGKILAGKLEYIGIASTPVLWFLFALEYTGHEDWLTPKRRLALFGIPVLTLGLTLTNELHSQIWTKMSLDPQGYPPLVILGYGRWFWVNVAYSYILVLAGIVLYLIAYFQIQRPFRQQMIVMILGSIIPLTINAIRLFTLFPLHGFDLTPFTFAFSGALLALGLFRFNLIDLTPIAASLVMENLQDAVIVIDNSGRIVAINPTARQWLNAGQESIGQNALDVLGHPEILHHYRDASEMHVQLDLGADEYPRWLDTRISPLYNSRREILGRVVVARDNSHEQTLMITEKRHASQMELLNQITNTALQMPDLYKMLQVLADQIGLLLGADGAFITLWDDVEQRVIPTTAYGEFRDTYKNMKLDPGENTMTASVLRAGHPIPVEDVYNTPYMNPRLASEVPTRSLLGLPLIVDTKKVGAVLISFNQPHQFTAEEIIIGEQAAGQVALAIYKAQLYETEHRRARQMELLNSITRASLEVTTFSTMLQMMADKLSELFEADVVLITLWDKLSQKPILGAACGDLQDSSTALQFDIIETMLISSALEAEKPLAVDDVFNTPYLGASIPDRFHRRSLLALPLIAHDEKLGVALIAFDQLHHFPEQEIVIGEQAAAQIALAMSKAHLFDNVSRRMLQMGLVQEVSREMAESLDAKEICQKTVDAMVEAFGYSEAAISLLIDGNKLELIAIAGIEAMAFRPGYQQNISQGIIGHVADTHQPYFAKDISRDPYYFHPSNQGGGTVMAVPLIREQALIGVLYVQSALPYAITPDDTQILETIASHLVTAIQKARFHADINEHLISITTLQSVTQTVNSSLDLDNIFKVVVQLLKETYGYSYVSVYLVEESTLRLGAQAGYPEELILYEIPITNGITGRTLRTRQIQFLRNVKDDPDFLIASYEIESEICIPLINNEHVLGVLNIESNSSRPLTEKDINLLNAFAGPVAMAIDNARLHAKITSLAITDGMTGLVNRHAFDQTFEFEMIRAARYEYTLALIMVDIDAFKIYNDTYGHPAGDERIKAIAGLLRKNVRDPDIAARYGGEEFVVLLPHTNKAGAMALAERLRESAEAQAPEGANADEPITGYTLSLGVACFPDDGVTPADLLLAADNAELAAKRLGKNRVCVAGN